MHTTRTGEYFFSALNGANQIILSSCIHLIGSLENKVLPVRNTQRKNIQAANWKNLANSEGMMRWRSTEQQKLLSSLLSPLSTCHRPENQFQPLLKIVLITEEYLEREEEEKLIGGDLAEDAKVN